ncbi:uncharacterized protein LOC119676728 [Teleopsis dalmanni]|uniref:uncharacterized protein LOC119676728 n=1 Tax=Teleopsis dalmanni TaxID=139649 RepID=UPI0018CE417A|nr:uncharacterized protein LOC119676728 [Teleopsis dalmanni]
MVNHLYDKVLEILFTSADQARRRSLISSLGCATKRSQLDKFIESSIDLENSLRTQERTIILNPVYSRSETGLLACIEFLNENWEAYAALTVGTFGGSKPLDSDIKGMSQYVVTKDQETKLLALVEKVKDSDAVNSNLETSVKSNINANFNWLENNRNSIINWITDYRTDGGVSITAFSLTMVMSVAVFISRLF